LDTCAIEDLALYAGRGQGFVAHGFERELFAVFRYKMFNRADKDAGFQLKAVFRRG
jgi:hypothetical protein